MERLASGHHVPDYPVAGVSRTLAALEMLVASDSLSIAELRRRLDVGASTAHRLLAMLVFHGYAERAQDSRYAPGPALTALARGTVLGRGTPDAVRATMEAVARLCGETVHVGTLVGTDVLYTDAIDSPAVLRVTTRVGVRQPAHGTSLGRAILAELDDDDLLHLYPDGALPELPSAARYTRDDLAGRLAEDRGRGWSENHGDVEEGVTSFSVAVRGTEPVRLGLSISGPSTRMPPERVADLARLLVRERNALEKRLR